jgi:hypothetical protein
MTKPVTRKTTGKGKLPPRYGLVRFVVGYPCNLNDTEMVARAKSLIADEVCQMALRTGLGLRPNKILEAIECYPDNGITKSDIPPFIELPEPADEKEEQDL